MPSQRTEGHMGRRAGLTGPGAPEKATQNPWAVCVEEKAFMEQDGKRRDWSSG